MPDIKIKGIIDEDFVNYKKPSMVLMFPYCTFKCGNEFCQNSSLITEPNIDINISRLCERYLSNDISEAVVLQGMEPFDSYMDVLSFINTLRHQYKCNDDIVIYTGYTKEECLENGFIQPLKDTKNIIIKFGRYIPNQNPHYDEVLGVNLASDNQYAERIS